MSKETFRAKQEWLEAVMASDHTPAQKVFAFAVYQHAYGNKIESFPDTEEIVKVTGLAASKFPSYRRSLFASGALSGEKVRKGKYKQENYVYTLNLDWQSHVPSRDMASESHVPTGSEPCTQRVEAMYPEGRSRVPRGVSNTTSNTTKKTTSKTTTMSPVPDGPVDREIPSSLNYTSDDDSANYEELAVPLTSRETVTNGHVPTGNTDNEQGEVVKDGRYWRELRKQRPLTKEEKEEMTAACRAYQESRREKEVVLSGEPW